MLRKTISGCVLLVASFALPSCGSQDDGSSQASGVQACARAPGPPVRPAEYPWAAANLPDGSVIVVMGDVEHRNHTKKYDVPNNRWTDLPDFPVPASGAAGATTDTTAYILVYTDPKTFGAPSDLWLYPFDEAAGAWGSAIAVPQLPPDGQGSILPYYSARPVGRGRKVYIVAGYSVVYDETTHAFSPMAQMPFAPNQDGVAFARDGKLYSLAEKNAVYDPALDRWSLVPDSLLFATGGAVAADDLGHVFSFQGRVVNVLDVASRTWTLGPELPYDSTGICSVHACDGRIYVFGGYGGTQRLDPRTMVWDAAE